MSAQWAQFLRVISIASILSCAPSAVLVLMYAQVAQFQKNKLQIWQRSNPRAANAWGFFIAYDNGML